jgi:hypothetical protein
MKSEHDPDLEKQGAEEFRKMEQEKDKENFRTCGSGSSENP